MITATVIYILLVSVFSSAVAKWPFPVPSGTFLGPPSLSCKLSLNCLDPCFPLHDPTKPTPACCEAVAPLHNKVTQMNLCICLKESLTTAWVAPNITALGILFSACGVSVKLPPVAIPEDMDCTDYVLDGDSTVGPYWSYWAMVGDPSDDYHWQLRFRL